MFSFLSSGLMKGMAVVIVLLAASTAFFAYRSYSLTGDLAVAEERVGVVTNANLSLQKSLKQQEQSCKADDVALVELEAEKKELSEKVESLNGRIEALSKKTPFIVKDNQKEIDNENAYIDNSSRLSPELTSLLTEAYCSVEPDSVNCPKR